METSEVLYLAADRIEERGWVGTNGKGWAHDGGGPLCIEGGIAAAMGAAVNSYGGFTSGPNLCPAGQAVRDYLSLGVFDKVSTSRCLFQWNDEMRYVSGRFVNARTSAEVIETLRACALLELAKENSSLDEAVSA